MEVSGVCLSLFIVTQNTLHTFLYYLHTHHHQIMQIHHHHKTLAKMCFMLLCLISAHSWLYYTESVTQFSGVVIRQLKLLIVDKINKMEESFQYAW